MSNELEAFRQEVRAFIDANAPDSLRGTRGGRFDGFWGGRRHPRDNPDQLAWCDAMADKGWNAPHWPKEYGGAGLSREHAEIVHEELVRAEMPPGAVGFGFTMIGPTLLDYGNEEQKLRHLPAICRGEVRWCQGYSEPGAGSDLAGVSTKAELDGDHFIVNGQKIWTSFADKSDWIFALVRTNPDVKKQAGITFLLIDMMQEGVTTRPIDLISGSSPFCEVFFDNVRVPLTNVVGEIDAGWTVAKALLQYERSSIGVAIGGQLVTAEQDLVEVAREFIGPAEGPIDDPLLRAEIAEWAMDAAAFDLVGKMVAQAAEAHGKPGTSSSILKVCGSELKQRRWELSVRLAGADALGWEGQPFAERERKATREWLRSRANSIEGGSSEIQLNIIAKRVLGLPS